MDRDTFDRVWRRVQGQPPGLPMPPLPLPRPPRPPEPPPHPMRPPRPGHPAPPPPDGGREKEELERFLTEEERLGRRYDWLRRHAGPTLRREAQRALQEQKGRMQRLETEYYLRFGDSFLPRLRPEPFGPGAVGELRRACLEEERGAEALRRAADRRDVPASGLYRRLAEEKEQLARRLRARIGQLLR